MLLTRAYIIPMKIFNFSLIFLFFHRKDSDSRLENLAAISGGKTYFVKDGKSIYGNTLFMDL